MADLTFEEISDNYDDLGAELAAKDAEIQRLRQETLVQSEAIETLRKLLRDGLTSNIPEWKERVREALGE